MKKLIIIFILLISNYSYSSCLQINDFYIKQKGRVLIAGTSRYPVCVDGDTDSSTVSICQDKCIDFIFYENYDQVFPERDCLPGEESWYVYGDAYYDN
jgi:hypothetical protein